MSRIEWGKVEDRKFESGIDRGVLYPISGPGVPWNGLVSVEETVIGGEQTPYYFEGTKYLDAIGAEDFQAILTALGAPPEFNASDGIANLAAGLAATQQPRRTFGLAYRTLIGNGVTRNLGYKLHLVYQCTASPSGRAYNTVTDSVTPDTRSWTIDTVPPDSTSLQIKPTAHFVIDSTKSSAAGMLTVENALYGTSSTAPRLPTPVDIQLMLILGHE